MTRVFFTGDLLFGHKKAAQDRGFSGSVTAHDDAIINGWKELVKDDDEVWVLGNITMDDPRYALDVISDLPGRKHLICGPYDACHPMHRDSQRHHRIYLRSFESIMPYHRRRLCGQNVILSHFPYDRGSRMEVRAQHKQFRMPDKGHILIHAHTQQRGKTAFNGREISVGVDAWNFKPAPIEQVSRYVSDWVERQVAMQAYSPWDRLVGQDG